MSKLIFHVSLLQESTVHTVHTTAQTHVLCKPPFAEHRIKSACWIL